MSAIRYSLHLITRRNPFPTWKGGEERREEGRGGGRRGGRRGGEGKRGEERRGGRGGEEGGREKERGEGGRMNIYRKRL